MNAIIETVSIEITNALLLKANKEIKRNIVYIDPAWKYKMEEKKNNNGSMILGTASSHYPTMPLDDLKQLKINEIAAKDCVLFMWTTGPQLANAIMLIKAWGFKYKTLFMTWIKTHKGDANRGKRLGFYTRQSCEMVLMASRGYIHKYKNPRCKMVYNHFTGDSREHSRKPTYVKEIIDLMFPGIPRIEIFARESEDLNWDYFGNQSTLFNNTTTTTNEIKRDENLIAEIRKKQIDNAKRISEADGKKLNVRLIDKNNRYGIKNNNQSGIMDFFPVAKKQKIE